MIKNLIKRYGYYDEESLSDAIVMLAAEIEEGYQMAEVEYSAQEIMQHAVEFVKIAWQRQSSTLGYSFCSGYKFIGEDKDADA